MVYKSPLVYTNVYFCNECKILQVSYICSGCASVIRKNKVRLFKTEKEKLKHWLTGIPVPIKE